MTGQPAATAPFSDRAHEVTPVEGSAVRTKPGFGAAPANLLRAEDYPVEAIDQACGEIVRSEHIRAGWTHTGRRPGDPR
jgi:hypothetical protein